MKSFRTEISPAPSRSPFGLRDSIMTQGSCFADAIGSRLAACKFKTLVNPFGVVYNPESIHRALAFAIFNEGVPDDSFVQHQGIHSNFHFHSRFSSPSRKELTNAMMDAIGGAHYFLKDCGWLVLTYGTAWVYRRLAGGEIVANCHKMPAADFSKALMEPAEVVASFTGFYRALKAFNPRIRIILTVSPVRHLKDSLPLNGVSKSVLRLACHTLANQFQDVEYFPAFEMMVDDLRDYRFYRTDMLHPTDEAEDYIWEQFTACYLDAPARSFLERWKTVRASLDHRPFHPDAPAHQQFLRTVLAQLHELKSMVNVDEEEALVRKQLK